MATNLKMANAAVNTEADALGTLLNAGLIRIYDGTQPATADTTSGASVLGVTLTFGNPAFGAATAGVITANTIAAVTAIASITATWARFLTIAEVPIMDGSVGTIGCDINLNSVSIGSGALVTITNVAHTVTK